MHNRRKIAGTCCTRFKPFGQLTYNRGHQTAGGVKIQTADKAQEPLYAKGERKRIDSFFYSLLLSKPYGVRVITVSSTRPRFAPGLFWNPAVRVPVLGGSVMEARP